MSAGLRLSFVFDPLSILMATLALFMAAAVSIYSLGYAKPENSRERKLFSIAPWLFCLFSCLSVFSSDWFFFALFLELSSVVLFFMILPVNFRTAVYYLLAQLSGSLLVLLGAAFMLRACPRQTALAFYTWSRYQGCLTWTTFLAPKGP